MRKLIKGSVNDNDRILSLILSKEIKKAREKKGLKGICDDLGIIKL